jgi:hypothetical protein
MNTGPSLARSTLAHSSPLVTSFSIAEVWNFHAEGGGQIYLMVLLVHKDLADLFGHGELAQSFALTHSLPVIADGLVFIFEIETEHFFWIF